MAINLSLDLQLPVNTNIDRSDLIVLVLDLPLIPGAPSYRSNSSGQLVISHSFVTKDDGIDVVLTKTPKEEDDFSRKVCAAVEDRLTKSNCSHWIFDSENTILK